MQHVSLRSTTGEALSQVALSALRQARGQQTASVGKMSVRNADGSCNIIGAGGVVLGTTADLNWLTASGNFSIRNLSMQLSQVQQTLADGGIIQTTSKRNTISVNPPESTAGFASGAFWTQVESETSLVAKAIWQLVDGQWVEQDLGATTLITPTMDAGLINAAAVAAQMIVSGEMWSSDTNPRFGLTTEGFQGFDETAAETVHIDGKDNFLHGTAELGRVVFKRWSATPGARFMDQPRRRTFGNSGSYTFSNIASQGTYFKWSYFPPDASFDNVASELTFNDFEELVI